MGLTWSARGRTWAQCFWQGRASRQCWQGPWVALAGHVTPKRTCQRQSKCTQQQVQGWGWVICIFTRNRGFKIKQFPCNLKAFFFSFPAQLLVDGQLSHPAGYQTLSKPLYCLFSLSMLCSQQGEAGTEKGRGFASVQCVFCLPLVQPCCWETPLPVNRISSAA